MFLYQLHCIYRRIPLLSELSGNEWRIKLPCHLHWHTYLIQLYLSTGNDNTPAYRIYSTPQHLLLQGTDLGALPHSPLKQPLYILRTELHITGVIQPYQLFPLRVEICFPLLLVLLRQSCSCSLSQVIPCIEKLRIEIIAVSHHCEIPMGRDGTELRGQHRNAIQHVLLWAYSLISHAGNGNVTLEGLVFVALGGLLHLQQGSVGFLLEIHLREHSLHVPRILHTFYSALPCGYCLELPV